MYVELIETTDWSKSGSPNMPNHTYYLNDKGACIAYRIRGEGEVIYFKNAMGRFSKRYRTFKTKKLQEIPN